MKKNRKTLKTNIEKKVVCIFCTILCNSVFVLQNNVIQKYIYQHNYKLCALSIYHTYI
jgi:hypothetical protein